MRPFATTWMDLEVIMLNEITDTERQILFGLTYTRNLKKDGLTETENSVEVIRGWGLGVMGRCWSKGTSFQLEDKFWGCNVLHSDFSE